MTQNFYWNKFDTIMVIGVFVLSITIAFYRGSYSLDYWLLAVATIFAYVVGASSVNHNWNESLNQNVKG